MGHIISNEGVKVDPKNIKVMMDWSVPKTLKKLRGFLGLIGYYNKFVQNYGRIATPLTTLTKKDAFSWTLEATQAFEQLKEAIVGHNTHTVVVINDKGGDCCCRLSLMPTPT